MRPIASSLALTLLGLAIAFAGCRRDGRLPGASAPRVVPKAAPYPFPNRQPTAPGGAVVSVPTEPSPGATASVEATAAHAPPGRINQLDTTDDDGRDLRLRLETSRSAYRWRDTVSVRVAMTNASARPFHYVVLPPWASAHLTVTDASGRVVAPTHEPAGYYLVSTHHAVLAGGQTRAWSWDTGEWTPIAYWGYRDLAPGRYTLAGAPILWSGRAFPDTTVRSNRVRFTIVP